MTSMSKEYSELEGYVSSNLIITVLFPKSAEQFIGNIFI
jgi:hypothetical protein